jgi:hypothetical protein
MEKGLATNLKSWIGQDYLIQTLRAGDCFGEMAAINPIGKGFVGINRIQCPFEPLEKDESAIGAILYRHWIWRSTRSPLSCQFSSRATD